MLVAWALLALFMGVRSSAAATAVVLVAAVTWLLRSYTFTTPALFTELAMGGGILLMVAQAYASLQWRVWGYADPAPLRTALSTVPPFAIVPLVFAGLAFAARGDGDRANRLLVQSLLFNIPAFCTLSVMRSLEGLILVYAPLAFLWQWVGAVVGLRTYLVRR